MKYDTQKVDKTLADFRKITSLKHVKHGHETSTVVPITCADITCKSDCSDWTKIWKTSGVISELNVLHIWWEFLRDWPEQGNAVLHKGFKTTPVYDVRTSSWCYEVSFWCQFPPD